MSADGKTAAPGGAGVVPILGLVLAVVAVAALIGWLALRRSDIPFETLEARYATPQSRYLALGDGVRLHYREWGNPRHPTVVLVHGFSASTQTWDAWAEPLSRTRHVVAIDLPGHGLTRGQPARPARLTDFVPVLDAAATSLGLARFTLVGNSMGGDLAWRYALARPDRVKALVLVDAAGWPVRGERGLSRAAPLLGFALHEPGRTLIGRLDARAQIRRGLRLAFADPARATDAMVTRYAELSRAPGHRDILLDLTRDALVRPTASARALKAIAVPALVMVGEQDRLVPPAFGRRFAEAIPGARLIVYPGIGHLPQEEAADLSLRDLTAFLDIVDAPAKAPAPRLTGQRPAVERRDPGALIFY